MRNNYNKIKEIKEMKNILLTLIAMVLPLIGFAENQTAPTDTLKSWVGDFTDTDNDGMTDVAELKYGYDPTDGNSFPNVTYHASDYSSTQTIDDGKFGGENDTIFYSFQSYDDATIKNYKRFLTKVLPIMYYRLGNPVKTQVVKFWNRYPTGSGWMTVATTNPMIYTDGSLNYRLIVHELFHAWSGSKGPVYRSTYNRLNKYEVSLTGWEEVADGIAQEILIDYIEAYPTDGVSTSLAYKSGNQLFGYREFGTDLIQHKEWTHGGGFQVDGITTLARYGITSNVGRKFMVADEIFYRKFFSKYYAIIEENPEIRFDNESLINLYASITPSLNGVSTKAFLSSIPALRGTKLPNKFHAVARPTDNINANFQVFCGFADNHRGELWWSTSIRSKEALSGFGIPSWFPTFHADDGYFYADTRNEKYVFTVKNLQDEVVKQVEGQLNDTTRSDGGPSNLSPSYVTGCNLSNFELGLYKANVAFPRFKSVTDDYISEDTYLLGMSGFPFHSSTRHIVVGIDTTTQLASVSLKINEQVFTPVQVGENAVIFNIDSVAKNTRGEIEILVTSTQNQSHSFLRTLTLQGVPDRPKYTHNRFVIVDTDFDGVEDMYGSADDVKEEDVVDDTTTPIEDTNDTEVVVDDTTTPIEDTNDTEVVVDTPKEDTNDTEVVVDTPKEDTTEEVVREAPELPPVVTNVWDSATSVGNNWFFVEWFGYFYKVEGNGWVFNEKLGWFYTEWASSFDSVWLFHEDLGWVWTTSEFFPYLYNPKTASWVYVVEGGFFDFNTNEWNISE